MKKINYIIGFILSGLLGFSSCQTDEISGQTTGMLEIEVSVDNNPEVIITRSGVDVDDLQVKITGSYKDDDGNNIEYERLFTSYRDLKDTGLIELKRGSYTVEAYSSVDEIALFSETPTYYGSKYVTISGGITFIVEVECKMREVQVQLDLSAIKDILEEGTLSASMGHGDVEIYPFHIDEDGITNAPYFRPDNSLQIIIQGKYNDWDLGTLGKHLLTEVIDKGEINGNMFVKVVVELASPDNLELDATQSLRFNLQTISAQ